MSVNISLYASLLKAVARGKKPVFEIAAEVGCSTRVGRLVMGRLHTLGLVYIAGWMPSKKGPASACWQMGHQKDVPSPVCNNGKRLPPREKRPLRPRVVGVETLHFSKLIRALAEPVSAEDIRVITGRAPSTIYRSLRTLREVGLAHICEWDRPRHAGDFAPLWQFAIDKADKARPRAYTAQELHRRYHVARKQRNQTLTVLRALSANSSVFNQAA